MAAAAAAEGARPAREALLALLEKHSGNRSAVAKELKKHRTQLGRWLKHYGIGQDTAPGEKEEVEEQPAGPEKD